MRLGEVPHHLLDRAEIHDQRRFRASVAQVQQAAHCDPPGFGALLDERSLSLLGQLVGLAAQIG